jgi:hypothetical protein
MTHYKGEDHWQLHWENHTHILDQVVNTYQATISVTNVSEKNIRKEVELCWFRFLFLKKCLKDKSNFETKVESDQD